LADLTIPIYSYKLTVTIYGYDLTIPVYSCELAIAIFGYDLKISIYSYELTIAIAMTIAIYTNDWKSPFTGTI